MPKKITTVSTDELIGTKEHQLVRLPTIEKLKNLGWTEGQLQWSPEWRVPKTPSEAAKREAGKSFESFPCDLVIFASEEEHGAVEALLIIFEFKQPELDEDMIPVSSGTKRAESRTDCSLLGRRERRSVLGSTRSHGCDYVSVIETVLSPLPDSDHYTEQP